MRIDSEHPPMMTRTYPLYSRLDISSKAFWALTSDQRELTFAQLRADDPVSWQRPVEDAVSPDPNDPGYWAVVRHADIRKVSRDNHTFVSGHGVQFDLLPPSVLEMSQSFLALDDPRHGELRNLVASTFTPRQVARIDKQIRDAAVDIVGTFAHETSEIDFVERCGTVFPARLFCDMFGVPAALRESVQRASGELMAWADPDALAGRSPAQLQAAACATLHEIALDLAKERRRHPAHDLFDGLVRTEVDGRRLTDAEIGSIFVLMAVAGTDTTKHTAALTVSALCAFPDQRAWLSADFGNRIGTAVEEFIRYASPVMTFRRTAVTDTTLGNKEIRAGEKVVMFYPSGNRDSHVFVNPDRFYLARDPNPHVGFGGGGVHFCLGSHFAKSMLRELFRELLGHTPNFEAGEPVMLGTNFMRGVKRLPFLPRPGAN